MYSFSRFLFYCIYCHLITYIFRFLFGQTLASNSLSCVTRLAMQLPCLAEVFPLFSFSLEGGKTLALPSRVQCSELRLHIKSKLLSVRSLFTNTSICWRYNELEMFLNALCFASKFFALQRALFKFLVHYIASGWGYL